MKNMKKYISMIAASLLAVSCVDTVILPDDKTVDEDFWKSKSDVKLMVNGAYKSMLSSDLIARLIVWGDLRSDELLPVSSVNDNATYEYLQQINTGNTQYDNRYATWGSFYSVINNCNIVLSRAAEVMSEDPSYTQGDYLADCSEMTALRSLCYFYLVRNFRDVSYTEEAFTNSSQDMDIQQSAPDSVLNCLIRDLEAVEGNAIAPNAYSDWRRVGYFNRDGIDALLADIYLWRASVKHSAADYEKAIAYCDKVIESKKAQHQVRVGEVDTQEYPLAEGRNMFDQLFIAQNAEESIFELQFNGTSNSNTSVCQFFNRYASNRDIPYLRAYSIFGKGQSVYKTINNTADYRGLTNTYKGTTEELDLRKFVAITQYSPSSIPDNSLTKETREYANYRQNYIIYRLTDVMLMKAEALVALATADDDIHLREAFNLVREVNTRAIEIKTDSIRWVGAQRDFAGRAGMEQLVLEERLRELAFEGKRWYDLMRYNYRNIEGVDYTTTLFDQNDRNKPFVNNYPDMVNLMVRKLGASSNAVAAKMRTEPTLYMPVSKTDMEVCPALRQNPVYGTTGDYSKNY